MNREYEVKKNLNTFFSLEFDNRRKKYHAEKSL